MLKPNDRFSAKFDDAQTGDSVMENGSVGDKSNINNEHSDVNNEHSDDDDNVLGGSIKNNNNNTNPGMHIRISRCLAIFLLSVILQCVVS
jgi:hypothetical protein